MEQVMMWIALAAAGFLVLFAVYVIWYAFKDDVRQLFRKPMKGGKWIPF